MFKKYIQNFRPDFSDSVKKLFGFSFCFIALGFLVKGLIFLIKIEDRREDGLVLGDSYQENISDLYESAVDRSNYRKVRIFEVEKDRKISARDRYYVSFTRKDPKNGLLFQSRAIISGKIVVNSCIYDDLDNFSLLIGESFNLYAVLDGDHYIREWRYDQHEFSNLVKKVCENVKD